MKENVFPTDRPVWLKISRDALRHNVKEIYGHSQKPLCAVIKADAYGHGAVQIALVYEKMKEVEMLAVAIPQEGITLREAGIKKPILIFGGVNPQHVQDFFEFNLTPSINSDEQLLLFNKEAQLRNVTKSVHLVVDTGMGRIGVSHKRFYEKIIKRLKSCENINADGIFTHYADIENKELCNIQTERFNVIIERAEMDGILFKWCHVSKSGTLTKSLSKHENIARPGLALFGIYQKEYKELNLFPVASLKTRVVYFKTLMKGESVGYSSAYIAKEDFERIITLPVGYADGLPRRLSNKGSVIIGNKKYPIVGKVCMDQCMVSLGTTGEAYPNDKVILVGESKDTTCKVSFEEIAEICDTTPHEISTCISVRVPRVYE